MPYRQILPAEFVMDILDADLCAVQLTVISGQNTGYSFHSEHMFDSRKIFGLVSFWTSS